jgi:hypothetical protein
MITGLVGVVGAGFGVGFTGAGLCALSSCSRAYPNTGIARPAPLPNLGSRMPARRTAAIDATVVLVHRARQTFVPQQVLATQAMPVPQSALVVHVATLLHLRPVGLTHWLTVVVVVWAVVAQIHPLLAGPQLGVVRLQTAGVAHVHSPPVQFVWATQAVPQLPQFALSELRFVQAVPQQVGVAGVQQVVPVVGHAPMQVPLRQQGVLPMHLVGVAVVLHAPQLLTSVWMLVQVWPQQFGFAVVQQTVLKTPAQQSAPVGQVLPQEWQCCGVPMGAQVPLVQQGVALPVQTTPLGVPAHPPQLLPSELTFVQFPPQQVGFAPVQQLVAVAPTQQARPVPQTLPQVAQLVVDPSVTQRKLQQAEPAPQTLPQVPQLGFTERSEQVEPSQQAVVPLQQKKVSLAVSHTWLAAPHVRQVATHARYSAPSSLPSPSAVEASILQRILQAIRLPPARATEASPSPSSASRLPPAKPPTHFRASRRVRAPARPLASSSNRFRIWCSPSLTKASLGSRNVECPSSPVQQSPAACASCVGVRMRSAVPVGIRLCYGGNLLSGGECLRSAFDRGHLPGPQSRENPQQHDRPPRSPSAGQTRRRRRQAVLSQYPETRCA